MNSLFLSKQMAQKAVVEYGHKLIQKKLVAASWGNISVKIGESMFAITPSGKGYESLQPENIVIINNKLAVEEGSLTPSSESKLHVAIYEACPEAQAIIHTHSIYASAMAAMHKPILPIIEDIVQIVGGQVNCADYALPGTQKLADNAVAALSGRKAALLANHGAVCWGKSLEDALIVAEVLEKSAQIAIICASCGGAVVLPDEDIQVMHNFYNQHYSKRQTGEER